MRRIRLLFFILLCGIVIWNLLSVLLPQYKSFINNNDSDDLYHNLENLFNQSQYRQKNPTSLIPDQAVFRYAARAYLKGVDPILINSEHTPLGKYIIALSLLVFHNDSTIIIFFSILTLFAVWLLSWETIKDKLLAMIPVVIFSSDKIFLDQLRIAPLLDIIQLPFIFLSLHFFLQEYKRGRFLLTSIMIGFVIATKTLVPGILLVFCFFLFFMLKRLFRSAIIFLAYLPLTVLILILSYTQTFLAGYSFRDFLGFQKWIFLYQQSKLIYPFSVWKLIFLNQWQTWWGNRGILPSAEWQIAWPIFSGLLFISILLAIIKRIKTSPVFFLLIIWSGVYFSFLSLGAISSRFLLPVLPVIYIIGVYTLKQLFNNK